MKKNREIPSEIKRQLRQEAGFGCCICGIPIIEYHHIKLWSKNKQHNVEDMMVLCPNHHHSIESYSEENQRNFKTNPYNKSNPSKSGSIIISQGICAINTGSIYLLGDGPIITSDNKSYLEYYINEFDIFEISLNLYNKANKLILQINKNEWLKGDALLWDIEFLSASKRLIIREIKGDINITIDAREIPLVITGKFWINGNLLNFSKKGIVKDNLFFLKSEEKSTSKFGIWHFEEDAFKLQIGSTNKTKLIDPSSNSINSNSVAITGSNYLSGCTIDITKDNNIVLMPKQFPYEWRKGSSMKFERAECVLIQAISTISYFNYNISINRDLSSPNPFIKGIDIISTELRLIYFKLRLARFYALIQSTDKAFYTYQEIHKTLHEYYNKPNIEEAELLFEISKFVNTTNNRDITKKYFIESFICFINQGQEPYRLLMFGDKIFYDDEICYCGSNKNYNNCHKKLVTLKKDVTLKKIVIDLKKDIEYKITIYLLKEHKEHWSVTRDEYAEGYKIIYQQIHKNNFELNINVVEVPIIIRLDSYGFIPLIMEFVLREKGFNLKIN
jgi:hypothetical protein